MATSKLYITEAKIGRIRNGMHRVYRCGHIMMYLLFVTVAAYPAVYGQFPQAIPQPMTAVAPTQREGKYKTLINV